MNNVKKKTSNTQFIIIAITSNKTFLLTESTHFLSNVLVLSNPLMYYVGTYYSKLNRIIVMVMMI